MEVFAAVNGLNRLSKGLGRTLGIRRYRGYRYTPQCTPYQRESNWISRYGVALWTRAVLHSHSAGWLLSADPLLALCAWEGFVFLADSPFIPYSPRIPIIGSRLLIDSRARAMFIVRSREASPCEHVTTATSLRSENANMSANQHRCVDCIYDSIEQHRQKRNTWERVGKRPLRRSCTNNTSLSLTLHTLSNGVHCRVCCACVNREHPLERVAELPFRTASRSRRQ